MAEIYFFDLDRTLVKANITKKFFISFFLDHRSEFLKKAFFNSPLILDYVLHPEELDTAHKLIVEMICDEYDSVKKFSDKFIFDIFSKELFMPVYEDLKTAFHCGKRVVILSAAPNFIIDPISKSLGIKEAYGSVYEKDENKSLKLKSVLSGREKASIALNIMQKANVEKKNVTVYSDSFQDLELLCLAGVPVAVNPDKKLERIAKEENWRIIR